MQEVICGSQIFVDAEIEKNKASKISDLALNNLISDLKAAMSKKSDF